MIHVVWLGTADDPVPKEQGRARSRQSIPSMDAAASAAAGRQRRAHRPAGSADEPGTEPQRRRAGFRLTRTGCVPDRARILKR